VKSSGNIAAIFDVDGTLSATNVLVVFADLQRFRLNGARLLAWWSWFIVRAPYYGILDLVDRPRFNTAFCRNYGGVPVSDVHRWQQERAPAFWRARLFPEAAARVASHQQQGHKVIIVSGGLKPMLEPLVSMLGVDALYAAEPEIVLGTYTGRLVGAPPVHQGKVLAIRRAASEHHLDLQRSFTYADHYGDRHFLESAGSPTAVNPNAGLRREAAARGWNVARWRRP
jgi:HAD superfamily hydrolase (TIGR01490 family)